MKTQTFFRADDYISQVGDFVGFFTSKEAAESEIEYNEPCNATEGKHSQITEFTVQTDKNPTDLSEAEIFELWADAEIKNDFYYW